MLIEKIKSDGLAHLSYLIGDGGKAAVIDPRRDCEIYVKRAREHGLEITDIFETHRNEDLISGAPVLAEMTGAKVWHGPNADGEVRYAETVREGDCFAFGDIELRVLETPGHTFDHVCYAIHDKGYEDGAVGVFTGDALFVGDVGRTDFYPDQAEKVAGLLFDSLRKIEALGDQAIIYPAHGAGSVCGSGMASREFSTVGHERKNNPRLQIRDRDEFIAAKVAENHYYPPYFNTMERLNLVGGDAAPRIDLPPVLTLDELAECDADRVVDVRPITSFAGAHWPGALSLPESMISAFAGWFLDEDDRLALFAEAEEQAEAAAVHLRRIGYDRLVGVYTGLAPAVAEGKPFARIAYVDHETVAERLDEGRNDWTLLDVRAIDEVEDYAMEGAEHIYVGELNKRLGELDCDRHYTTMCASGARATVAAGWLASNGFEHVDIFLGSVGAWRAHHD
ncbi:MAG: MBL fold metallo-hydrolase [Sphingomonadaceae bacterium]|nr:MBL fold metallo-hydrolase [Sphingomonadaceae bacterium]